MAREELLVLDTVLKLNIIKWKAAYLVYKNRSYYFLEQFFMIFHFIFSPLLGGLRL